jgi:hypothetical protein
MLNRDVEQPELVYHVGDKELGDALPIILKNIVIPAAEHGIPISVRLEPSNSWDIVVQILVDVFTDPEKLAAVGSILSKAASVAPWLANKLRKKNGAAALSQAVAYMRDELNRNYTSRPIVADNGDAYSITLNVGSDVYKFRVTKRCKLEYLS